MHIIFQQRERGEGRGVMEIVKGGKEGKRGEEEKKQKIVREQEPDRKTNRWRESVRERVRE